MIKILSTDFIMASIDTMSKIEEFKQSRIISIVLNHEGNYVVSNAKKETMVFTPEDLFSYEKEKILDCAFGKSFPLINKC